MSRRILFVVKSLFSGGDAYQLRLLTGQVLTQGWDVHVALMRLESGEHHGFEPQVTIHDLSQHTDRVSNNTVRLRRTIQRLNPEIIHSWDLESALTCHLAAAGMRLERISTLLEIPPKKDLWFRMASKRFTRGTRLTVCHPMIADYLDEHNFIDRIDQTTIVPNAAPPAFPGLSNAREELLVRMEIENPESLVITAIADFTPRTRIKDLIWAASLLNCVQYDVHLLVFGSGPQRPKLKTYMDRTQSHRYVHLLNHSPLVELALAGSQVYWHSHLTRPTPTELMMAQSNKVPSVSVLGPGTDELVLHQQTAFATNYGARDEFARWTKYVLEQAEPTRQLVTQAHRHLQATFPLNAMIEPYLDLYQ